MKHLERIKSSKVILLKMTQEGQEDKSKEVTSNE